MTYFVDSPHVFPWPIVRQFYYEAISRALEELKANHPGEGIHLIGHSIGGALFLIGVSFVVLP